MILPIPPVAVAAGQLLGPAFACGLNLYATVALLGLASRFGWGDALPLGLRGLEHPLVIGSALLLYAVEFVVDKIRFADSAWDAIHTLIRPAAAALLAVLAFNDAALQWQVAAGAFAGAAALAAHGLKAGLRVRLNERRRPARTAVVSVLEDMLAATMAVAAMTRPEAAGGIALAVALLILVLGPRVVRPATLGLHVLDGRLRGFFGGRRWRSRDEIPSRLRHFVPPSPLGAAPPRAARAAMLRGSNGTHQYRSGWLVFGDEAPVFLYRRRLFGARRLPLPFHGEATLRRGLLADALELNVENHTYSLLLLKDGPDPRQTLAALSGGG
jgi:hypothetical protein